jgi:hypothetical protein
MKKILILFFIAVATTTNAQTYQVTKTVMVQYDTILQKWSSETIEENARFKIKINKEEIFIYGRMRAKYLLLNKQIGYSYKALDLHWKDYANIGFSNNSIVVSKEFDGVKNYIIYYVTKIKIK